MNENDLKIVRFTNISDFDFTGDLGARYGGRDFFVAAGKSLLVPLTIGDHLAIHLARQMVIRNSPVRDEKEMDGKGSMLPLWNEQRIEDLKRKILAEAYEEDKPKVLSETDRLVQKVKELNEVAATEDDMNIIGGNADASTIAITMAEDNGSEFVYKDKAEVIQELEKRNIRFDARSSKSNLEKLLEV